MLIEHLPKRAAEQPDEVAVLDEAGAHTFQQLAIRAAALAEDISHATQRPIVGLLLPSGAEFVSSFYGSLWAGKSVLPINFLMGEKEIAYVLANSGVDTVITIPFFAPKLAGTGLRILDLSQIAPRNVSPPPIPQTRADDLAVLMYTSGTSGQPKGVELTYGNLQSDVDAAIQHAALQHGHIFLGLIPLFHAFGLLGTMLAPIQLGSKAIYMARFNAIAAVKAIAEQKASLILAVPSMYGAMLHLKSASAADFAGVYALISGGEPLPEAVNNAFRQRFGQPIYEGYGLTETSPVVALNVPQTHRAGSVGRPIPGVTVRIVSDEGQDQPVGESGEVWLGGPMVMKGYRQLPQVTAEVLTPDRFFKTGDIGKFDSDGFLYIVGRKKELIIVGGEKAIPREIEDAIMKNPAVASAAVVGKKDPNRGEVPVAFILFKEGQTATPDALRQTCRDAGLPQWKIPREIFIETDLPRSPTGKVLKRVLQERVNAPG